MTTARGKAQHWLRMYAQRLATSYNGAALLEHRVTKGETREGQILDVLKQLLPQRTSVESGVVIVDSQDVESPKFDGVLVDRLYWPRLWEDAHTGVAMIESVIAALEIKSNLNASEIGDIVRKTSQLGKMFCAGPGQMGCPPPVCAFAYTCDNFTLAFFDFASAYAVAPQSSATMICSLNDGVLYLCRREADALVPADGSSKGLVPAAAYLAEDSLLALVYTLSSWAALRERSIDAYRAYNSQVFSATKLVYFDDDYLTAIAQDEAAKTKARSAYLRTGTKPFDETYEASRRLIGL